MNMFKAYTRQKVLSWGLSVFTLTEKGRPQTEVHHICFAAQLPDIDLPLHFLGLFLTAFLQRQGFILADRRTKVEKTFSSVQVLRPGFASQVTRPRTTCFRLIAKALYIIGSAEALPILCVRYFR